MHHARSNTMYTTGECRAVLLESAVLISYATVRQGSVGGGPRRMIRCVWRLRREAARLAAYLGAPAPGRPFTRCSTCSLPMPGKKAGRQGSREGMSQAGGGGGDFGMHACYVNTVDSNCWKVPGWLSLAQWS